MFLAYKSVAQKPIEFFLNLCSKQNFGGIKDYCHEALECQNDSISENNSIQGQNVLQNINEHQVRTLTKNIIFFKLG